MNKLNILVIDDEESTYDIVTHYCKKNTEYDIFVRWLDEVTADPAVIRLEETDLIILDYQINSATGMDMLAILDNLDVKTVTEELMTPVIMLSNTQDVTVPAQGLLYGIANFLPKSRLSAPLLNQTINDVIKKHRLRLKLEKKNQ